MLNVCLVGMSSKCNMDQLASKCVFGRYEFQMQYGSIGWFVGETLGYAQATLDKHVISFIGDEAFRCKYKGFSF